VNSHVFFCKWICNASCCFCFRS